MKLSVLITTYNLEKYIAYTLDSVFMQETNFDFEVLIGDDGSEDNTLKIVEEYQQKYPNRISVYIMPREKGVKYNKIKRAAANRLNIASEAKGEYCTFLDGDDYYTDNKKLQKQVDILENPNNKDCALCAHNIFMAYEDGTGFMLSRAKKERKFTFKQYWKLTYICTHGLLFRNYFNENFPKGNVANYFDDNMIALWAFSFGKMYYIPDNMAAYRQLDNSNWNEKTKLQQLSTNILDYGIELEFNPKMKALSNIRHFPEFKYLFIHQKEITKESIFPNMDYAETDSIEEALNIYNMREANFLLKLGYLTRFITSGIAYYMAKAGRFIEKRTGRY